MIRLNPASGGANARRHREDRQRRATRDEEQNERSGNNHRGGRDGDHRDEGDHDGGGGGSGGRKGKGRQRRRSSDGGDYYDDEENGNHRKQADQKRERHGDNDDRGANVVDQLFDELLGEDASAIGSLDKADDESTAMSSVLPIMIKPKSRAASGGRNKMNSEDNLLSRKPSRDEKHDYRNNTPPREKKDGRKEQRKENDSNEKRRDLENGYGQDTNQRQQQHLSQQNKNQKSAEAEAACDETMGGETMMTKPREIFVRGGNYTGDDGSVSGLFGGLMSRDGTESFMGTFASLRKNRRGSDGGGNAKGGKGGAGGYFSKVRMGRGGGTAQSETNQSTIATSLQSHGVSSILEEIGLRPSVPKVGKGHGGDNDSDDGRVRRGKGSDGRRSSSGKKDEAAAGVRVRTGTLVFGLIGAMYILVTIPTLHKRDQSALGRIKSGFQNRYASREDAQQEVDVASSFRRRGGERLGMEENGEDGYGGGGGEIRDGTGAVYTKQEWKSGLVAKRGIHKGAPKIDEEEYPLTIASLRNGEQNYDKQRNSNVNQAVDNSVQTQQQITASQPEGNTNTAETGRQSDFTPGSNNSLRQQSPPQNADNAQQLQFQQPPNVENAQTRQQYQESPPVQQQEEQQPQLQQPQKEPIYKSNSAAAISTDSLADVDPNQVYEEDAPLPSRFDVFSDVSLPYIRGKDTPFFWHIPRSGGVIIKTMMSHCLGKTLASEVGESDGHIADTEIKVVQLFDHNYVNVNVATPEGIERANKLGLVSSRLADAISSPHVDLAHTMFDSRRRGRAFVLLRHPVDRIISMYWFLKEANNPVVANMSLQDYAKSSIAENNWHVRILSDKMTGSINASHLELAKEVLRRKFVVGMSENKRGALARFDHYFKWKDSPKYEENFACRKMVMEDPHPWKHKAMPGSPSWKLFESQNSYDVKLYDYAKELFKEQANLYGL